MVKEKGQMTNNDIQNITQKTKDRATQNPTCRVTLFTNQVIGHE
jgi:hypothetical protein